MKENRLPSRNIFNKFPRVIHHIKCTIHYPVTFNNSNYKNYKLLLLSGVGNVYFSIIFHHLLKNPPNFLLLHIAGSRNHNEIILHKNLYIF